jgi:hypothetical protein
MVDCVRNCVHEFAGDCRSDQWRRVEFVIYLAPDIDRAIEKLRWDRSEGAQDSMRFGERERAIVFDPRVSLSLIIIDPISIQSLQQALEVVQAMTVMFPDRGAEYRWQFAREIFVAHKIQQRFALAQNFNNGVVQRRSFHK